MDNARAAWLLSGVLGNPSRILGVTAIVLFPGRAYATDAAEAFARAERDDAAFAFERALAEYDEAARLDPSSTTAMRASVRARDLREHSEGGFAPLTELERVRRDPRLASDRAAIDELARAAETFPPGLVRVEARMLAAEAYATRLGQPELAQPLWRSVATDPRTDKDSAAMAARSLVTYELARGDIAAAERVLATVGSNADVALARDLRRAHRRHRIHVAAIAMIVAMLLAAAVAIARAKRVAVVLARVRKTAGVTVAYSAFVAIAGGLLASSYAAGTARPFLAFGGVLVPLLVLAQAWGAAGASTLRARIVRAAVCASGVLATAFLVLEQVDVGYLRGLGL
jgi:hypothetical protein